VELQDRRQGRRHAGGPVGPGLHRLVGWLRVRARRGRRHPVLAHLPRHSPQPRRVRRARGHVLAAHAQRQPLPRRRRRLLVRAEHVHRERPLEGVHGRHSHGPLQLVEPGNAERVRLRRGVQPVRHALGPGSAAACGHVDSPDRQHLGRRPRRPSGRNDLDQAGGGCDAQRRVRDDGQPRLRRDRRHAGLRRVVGVGGRDDPGGQGTLVAAALRDHARPGLGHRADPVPGRLRA
jgi:hypothetical protein